MRAALRSRVSLSPIAEGFAEGVYCLLSLRVFIVFVFLWGFFH